ncbi:hypothetical protein [Candidatus Symbiothrix dinenymphae]|uniref:hypothetical protein n=1 Tax=Candidatus Symbiothrix dinenymphae TaxID=467085 RepID=UPI000702A78C|nr:hypothetical protein [Candidatus Symbiothrix dinenymphae]
MDTDYLSRNTYDAVITTAERFNHDLTLPFGVLAYDCQSEEEYLEEAEGLVDYWLHYDDKDELMDDIFFGETVDEKQFMTVLNKIKDNIKKVREIPEAKRKYDF